MRDFYPKSIKNSFGRITTKLLFFFLLLIAFQPPIKGIAQTTNLITPKGSYTFGNSVTNLSNGNFVITDPGWNNGTDYAFGAVYLYDGRTFTLISKLQGSKQNDRVGSGGIVPLKNGNFIVLSPNWNVDPFYVTMAGAITWVNGTVGLTDTISPATSLVGTLKDENIGENGFLPTITELENGNFVVSSPRWQSATNFISGAVTWGSGTNGVSGIISDANSLVGVSNTGIINVIALTNGNYVVGGMGAFGPSKGSVTWGNGLTGTIGEVSAANSLLGRQPGDNIGASYSGKSNQIVALTNGNYVIGSPDFYDIYGAHTGAVTWADGTKPTIGQLDSSNSLFGLGQPSVEGVKQIVTPLPNGNFVVASPNWPPNNSSNLGAVTWADGTKKITGYVDASNSLSGSYFSDRVGTQITVLVNGNYVVSSPNWYNAAGAVTLCNGVAGTYDAVSALNSIVGSSVDDSVGSGGVYPLLNGNFVVASPAWDNGATANAGAITWSNGFLPTTGPISSANSLTGNSTGDSLGSRGVFALSTGNFVAVSPYWNNGSLLKAGAVSFGSGTWGLNGTINSSNSLIGSLDSDLAGSAGVSILNNGNYVVASPNWQSKPGKVGAATWGNGKYGIAGNITEFNSITGSQDGDAVANAIAPLENGNFLVFSQLWQNPYTSFSGALTWGDGLHGSHGKVDSMNSLINSPSFYGRTTTISNGDFLFTGSVGNFFEGTFTYADGKGGTTGSQTFCNSLFGAPGDGTFMVFAEYNKVHDYVVVGQPIQNRVTIFQPNAQGIAINNDSATHGVSENAIAPIPFVNLASCRIITSILPIDSLPLNGNIRSVAFVDKNISQILGIPTVRRHFDISPETASDLSTSRITLYFNQSDFTHFNNNKGIYRSLPGSPSEVNSKANLRIIQEYGTSPTGNLGSYTSTNPTHFNVIDPVDSAIVWNDRFSRWEVTFDAKGFGGFFAFSDGSTTGIGTFKSENSSVIISPVPASSELNIKVMDAKLFGQTASVTDIQGRQIMRITLESHTRVDVRDWPVGVYCLRLADGRVLKVVKR